MATERLRTVKGPRRSGSVTRAQMRDIFLRIKEEQAAADARPAPGARRTVRERAARPYGPGHDEGG